MVSGVALAVFPSPHFFARTEEVGGNVKASKYVNYNE
jgi:hypothetical protein